MVLLHRLFPSFDSTIVLVYNLHLLVFFRCNRYTVTHHYVVNVTLVTVCGLADYTCDVSEFNFVNSHNHVYNKHKDMAVTYAVFASLINSLFTYMVITVYK